MRLSPPVEVGKKGEDLWGVCQAPEFNDNGLSIITFDNNNQSQCWWSQLKTSQQRVAPLAHEWLGTPGDHSTNQPHPKSQPGQQGKKGDGGGKRKRRDACSSHLIELIIMLTIVLTWHTQHALMGAVPNTFRLPHFHKLQVDVSLLSLLTQCDATPNHMWCN